MLQSKLCQAADFHSDWFRNASERMKEPFRYHRKLWEFCFIYQALLERGMLIPGNHGLGFGVGREPLPALFASHGCKITATDLPVHKAVEQGWVGSNQHTSDVEGLNERGLCPPDDFARLVFFQPLDMNEIDESYYGKYDFTWSSCAFEHCGSIELGKRFIINQAKCLKPGGTAVHTTEFNLSSNDKTIGTGPVVLFRKQDIESMAEELNKSGYSMEVDFTVGTLPLERYIDFPPYHEDYHLKLLIGGYVSTSIGLIITRDA
ncbi:hypothetical protein [Thermicanus aegyptius]|uniref:hypothetical protein n=1 Tax=Thermicanus aegyptius TaxID=94009 RepID=UPI000415A64F|nr:hypothetical protein [Thermicanus aegyptius]